MRTRFLLIALAITLVSCSAARSTDSGFPTKPVTIIAPANPGGGWDQTARMMQQALLAEKIVSVPVEVVNRPGAGGTIGLAELVTANRGDPHAIMVLGRVMLGAILVNRSAVTLNDTVPLARLFDEYEAIAVPSDSKFQTLAELIEEFKKDPKRVSWGGGSAGGTDHILVAMLAVAAGIDPRNINYIAHSGGGEAAVAVMGGHVTAGVSGFGEWFPHAQSGRLRFLAVSSDSRIAGTSTPTIRESGLDVVLANWRSVAAPPGTAPEAVQSVISALEKMRNSATWQDLLRRNYWNDSFLAGSEFEKYLIQETADNAATLQAMGLAPSSSLFPVAVGLGMLISVVWIIAGRKMGGHRAPLQNWSRFVLAAGLLMVYVLVFETAGYVLATTALIFSTARILHSRSWLRDLAVSAFIAATAYVVFELVLNKGLPQGWLPL
jgi:putative tricarboxylic transport membrane protein